jgi:DNA-binding transcriptional regulator YhcF (GntR family)
MGGHGAPPIFEGADKLLTARETCLILNIHRKTLGRWYEQLEQRRAAQAASEKVA